MRSLLPFGSGWWTGAVWQVGFLPLHKAGWSERRVPLAAVTTGRKLVDGKRRELGPWSLLRSRVARRPESRFLCAAGYGWLTGGCWRRLVMRIGGGKVNMVRGKCQITMAWRYGAELL